MRSRNLCRMVFPFHLFVACLLFTAGLSLAAPARDVALHEAWRIDAADESLPLLGRISDVVVDGEGSVFLLDAQQQRIFVFDRDGHFDRSFGQPGEGPGDVPRASDLCMLGGDLGVASRLPAAVVVLGADGSFQRRVDIPPPRGALLSFLFKVVPCASGFIVEGEYGRPGPAMNTFRYVARVSQSGEEAERFFELPRTVNGKPPVGKTALDYLGNRWCVAAGRVFASITYDAYRIDAWNLDTSPAGTIERPYEPLAWTDEERRNLKASLGKGLTTDTPDIPEHARCIEAIHAVGDGLLLVLTSRGARSPRPGSMGRFDVFGPDMQARGTVELFGEGLVLRDRYVFAGGRLFVVVESLPEPYDCYRQVDRDVDPMTVICYEIDADALASGP